MMQMILSHQTFRGVLSLLLLLFLLTAYSMDVQELDSCDAELNGHSKYTVLGNGVNSLNGWSHIANPLYEKEFSNLDLDRSLYDASLDNYVSDSTCTGSLVQNAILVVKLSDWTRQHSNGFEAQLATHSLRFGDVTHVLLDIRLNSAGTHILSAEQLEQEYSEYLSAQQLAEFDQGNVSLGITLFGEGALDQSSESLNSASIIEIKPSLLSDKWLRVLIPLSGFNSFTQKNYNNTNVDIKDFARERMAGFRVNAETTQGKQLRNILGDQWTADIPESFKQISISFRRIELVSMPIK